MKLVGILAISALAALAAACVSEIDDREDGRADHANESEFVFVAKGSAGCQGADCDALRLRNVNHDETRCPGPAIWRADCFISGLDWSQTGFPESVQRELESKILPHHENPPIILEGDAKRRGGETSDPWFFVVTDVWEAQGDGAYEGRVHLIGETKHLCSPAPCLTMMETRVNSSYTGSIDDLDFSTSEFTAEQQQEARRRIPANLDVLIAGPRTDQGGVKQRSVTELYLRRSVPQP